MKCLECGDAFANQNIRQHLLDIHLLTAEEYYLKVNPGCEPVCGVCGTPTELISLSIGFKKTCGIECLSIVHSKTMSKIHEDLPVMFSEIGRKNILKLHEDNPEMARQNGKKTGRTTMLKLHEDPNWTNQNSRKGGKVGGPAALKKMRENTVRLRKEIGFATTDEKLFFDYFINKFKTQYEPDIGLGNGRLPDFLINGILVVELQGGVHNAPFKKEQDAKKKKIILAKGYKYLAIWNEELKNLDKVYNKIKGTL